MRYCTMAERAWRWVRGVLWGLGLLVGLVVAVALLALAEASHLSGPLLRWSAARTGRELRAGAIEVHLLSRQPRLIARDVIIGNPPWSPPGTMARIGTLSAVFELPRWHRPLALRRLELRDVSLQLQRDAAGHANWHWRAPGIEPGRGPPLIHSLLLPLAHVQLDDERRHLQFTGTLSAGEAPSGAAAPLLHIEATGQLNAHPVALAINGEPLALAQAGRPYRFAYAARSSGSLLSGRGSLLRAFDLRQLDASYRASGEDLRDLYFLIGLKLPNTGAYRLAGEIERRGMNFELSSLQVSSGESEVSGHITTEWLGDHSRVNVQLSSQRLRLADLGERAAGREKASADAGRATSAPANAWLPATPLPLAALRRNDSQWSLHAQQLELGPLTLRAVAARLRIDAGLLLVPELAAELAGSGHIEGYGRLDARESPARVSLELRARDASVGLLLPMRKPGPPALDGSVQARLLLSGRGNTARALAADAQGTLSVVMPRGEMRASLSELLGLDLLRGLGLLITGNRKDVGVRCGVAKLEASAGIVHVQDLVIDTDPVLISGAGTLDLDDGSLDLTLRGRPKHVRLLHVQAPIQVRGTLRDPKVTLSKGALVKAGATVALGVLLPPLAAVLAFIDPKLAKNVDCAALLQQAQQSGARPVTAQAPHAGRPPAPRGSPQG